MKRLMLILLLPASAIAQTQTTECWPTSHGAIQCSTQNFGYTSPQQQPATGIDFGAVQRGRRQAEQDNMQDQLHRQQQELLELQQLQLREQREPAGLYAYFGPS